MVKISFLLSLIIQGLFTHSQVRHALVIGNGQYAYGSSLRNPTHDAQLISKKLGECGFNVIEKENLSKTIFKRSIEEFFSKIKNTNSQALFFYSGHGIQYKGENYLIPVDANILSEGDIEEQCIRLQLILNKMEDARTKVNIIILDACRNDPFSKAWNRGDDEKGLTNLSRTPAQSFIAFATAPSQVASDGKGTNSPYSAALAKYIVEPGLTIFRVFQKVSIEVRKQNANQSPWNNYSLDNDFYFTVINRDFPVGSRPMEFLVTEDCELFINGKNEGKFAGGIEFRLPYTPGHHRIRVVSQYDPSIYYDTIYNYNPSNNAADNLMSIPLNNKVLNSRMLQPLLDSIKYNMVHIAGGSFSMGTKAGNNDESPQHAVELSSFYISKFEVTQHQWKSIMGNNPSFNKKCNDCPVENITWVDASQFISALNALTNERYRLPTEAEWEFAARGGTLSLNYKFSGNQKLEKIGWFYENASNSSHPVGKKVANELGIVDMSGNVAEWCSDWYGRNYYSTSDLQNPKGPASGSEKVVRGGSWTDYDQYCKIISRNRNASTFKSKTIGFRLAKDGN